MRKTIKKTIALLLTFVMLLALAVPMVSAENASEQSTTYPTYEEANNGDLLWELDFREATSEITSGRTCKLEIADDGNSFRYGATTQWAFCKVGALSELPLNDNSVYTIEFKMEQYTANIPNVVYVDGTNGGFTIRNNLVAWAAKNDSHVTDNDTASRVSLGALGITGKSLGDSELGSWVKIYAYRVVVDVLNGTLKLYLLTEGDIWVLLTTRTDYAPVGDKLGVYFNQQMNPSSYSGKDTIISDVNVYKGGMCDCETTELSGERLLVLGDMSQAQNGVQGVTYNPSVSYDASGAVVEYAYTEGVHGITAVNTGSYREFGGKTNLPLGAGQKYTVKYLCKPTETAGIAFSATGTNASQTVRLSNNGDTVKLSVGVNSSETYTFHEKFVTLDTSIFNVDGYAEVAVEIDGYTLTVYINGENKLTCEMLLTKANNQLGAGYSSDLLTLAIAESATAGSEASSFKDIELYSGLVMSNNYFKVIEEDTYEYVELDKSVTSYTLPKAAKEGYMFCGWKVNGSDELVKSENELAVEDIETLEKVFVPVMSEIWWQAAKIMDGETDTGKRNVRFVSAIDSLNYKSIGYDVTITYGGNSYDKEAFNLKHVYSSLLASYGAEVVTLETLGYDDANGGYITAFVIKNVPTNVGNITVDLTPYQVTLDGAKVTGDVITVTLTADNLNK